MNESFFKGTMLSYIMYFPLVYNAFTFSIASIYLYYLNYLPLVSKALTFSYYMILILQEPARTKGKDTYSSSSLNYPKKVKELLNIQQIPNAYFFPALTIAITYLEFH